MSIELITALLFSSVLLLLFLGLPVAFALGGTAILFTILFWSPQALYVVATSAFGVMSNFLLIAVPLFIFMANVLQTSGIADDLYTMMHRWMGPLRGGLAMGTVVICTIFAAMAGISGAAAVTMGVVALPAMLKRRYDSGIALGCIAAGGALGQLIPPSLLMILYGSITGISVGQLFMGGVFPGLVLSALFIIYIGIRCFFRPDVGPSLPPEERAGWRPKLTSLRAIVLPVLLVIGVLGSIYTGIATPTEAAGVGAAGAIISALIYRRLNWQTLRKATINSLRLSAMVLWIAVAAFCFSAVFGALGPAEFVEQVVVALPIGRYGILITIQFLIILMGMFLDPVAIIFVGVPVFVPIIKALGFDPLWFGIVFMVNLEMSFLTPPFGYNLFYLKGVAPKGITMGHIYRSIIPFVILQAVGLAIIILFPQLALYLPGTMAR